MCTFPDCRDDQDGFVSDCSNFPMLLLKSLIYSGVVVIVALSFPFAKEDWNHQKGDKVLRVRVCMRWHFVILTILRGNGRSFPGGF